MGFVLRSTGDQPGTHRPPILKTEAQPTPTPLALRQAHPPLTHPLPAPRTSRPPVRVIVAEKVPRNRYFESPAPEDAGQRL